MVDLDNLQRGPKILLDTLRLTILQLCRIMYVLVRCVLVMCMCYASANYGQFQITVYFSYDLY